MRTATYDTDHLDGGWANVEDFISDALLVAFDGCHKIYLAMDTAEAHWFGTEYPITLAGPSEVMLDTVRDWFNQSCALRFVNAVWHNEQDPNAGFVNLISQFAEDDENLDDDPDDDPDEDDDA